MVRLRLITTGLYRNEIFANGNNFAPVAMTSHDIKYGPGG